jgi:hypothetical protein
MTRHGKAIDYATPVASSSGTTSDLATTESSSAKLSDPVVRLVPEPAPVGFTDSLTTGPTQRSIEEPTEEGLFAGETVRHIETIVESFRTNKIKKSQAIYKIGRALASEPTGDDELKSDSLERYAATLNGIEALASQSVKHGS